jgi:hypothetical protein
MSAVSAVDPKVWASVGGASNSAGVQIERARSTPEIMVAMPADR